MQVPRSGGVESRHTGPVNRREVNQEARGVAIRAKIIVIKRGTDLGL